MASALLSGPFGSIFNVTAPSSRRSKMRASKASSNVSSARGSADAPARTVPSISASCLSASARTAVGRATDWLRRSTIKRNWAYIGWTLFSGTSASNSASPIFIFNRRNSVIESPRPEGPQEISRRVRRDPRTRSNCDKSKEPRARAQPGLPEQKSRVCWRQRPRALTRGQGGILHACRVFSRLFGGDLHVYC